MICFPRHRETNAEMNISVTQNKFAERNFRAIYIQLIARRVFTISSQACFTKTYTIHTNTRSFVSSLFLLGNVCQQQDLPLFVSCNGSKCGFFLFFLLWGV